MADAAHLLRRAGFGGTAKELTKLAPRTRGDAVALLLGTKTRRSRPPAGKGGELALAKMRVWWLKQMQSPKWRLHEKLALFWHAHFATPWSAVPDTARLARQNGVLREHGLGAFRTLLYEITRDAAMLEFRDGARSGTADPNENFARALLEQYALGARDAAGMPNYVEADVVAFARGLTGFQLGPKDLAGQVDLEFFDDGMKQVFVGNAAEATGNLGVEDGSGNELPAGQNLLDLLFAHRDSDDRPTLARFIATKLWEWFAYPEPELALVDALADVFVASGYQTGALVSAILMRDEFYTEAARSSTPRTPVDLALASLRALGAKSNLAALPHALERMGMALFDPPAVEGWNRGEEWLSAGLVQRAARVRPGAGRGPLRQDLRARAQEAVRPEVDERRGAGGRAAREARRRAVRGRAPGAGRLRRGRRRARAQGTHRAHAARRGRARAVLARVPAPLMETPCV